MSIILSLSAGLNAQGILPPGYELPRVELPTPSPRDHLSFEGLELSGTDRTRLFLNLDHSRVNWADDTLRLVLGYPHPWTPASYYTLLLDGYEAYPKKTVAFIGGMKLRFPRRFNVDSGQNLRSIDRSSFSISRLDEYIVVADGDNRRWYFESPDDGSSWRLARIEQIKHPGLFTTLLYDGPVVTEVVYPNGRSATLNYRGDLPVEIRTPFGETVKLTYAEADAIERIEIYRKGDQPRARSAAKPVITYAFKYDTEGRITEYTAPSGNVYNCEYQNNLTAENKTQKKLFQVVVRRESDGLFKMRRDEIREGGEWMLKIGFGGPDRKPEDALTEYASRLELINHRWTTTGYTMRDEKNQTTIQTDKKGNATLEISGRRKVRSRQFDELGRIIAQTQDANTESYEYNDFSQKTRHIVPDGAERFWHFDDHARLLSYVDGNGRARVYEYDDRGFPARTSIGDRSYQFAFDEMGRMSRIVRPDGSRSDWTYDDIGRIIKRIDLSAETDQAVETRKITAWEYRGDRLVSIEYTRGTAAPTKDRLIYDSAGRLTLYRRADGSRVNYQFDRRRNRWLTGALDTSGESQIWTYHACGQVASCRTRHPGTEPRMTRYDVYGRRVTGRELQVRTSATTGRDEN